MRASEEEESHTLQLVFQAELTQIAQDQARQIALDAEVQYRAAKHAWHASQLASQAELIQTAHDRARQVALDGEVQYTCLMIALAEQHDMVVVDETNGWTLITAVFAERRHGIARAEFASRVCRFMELEDTIRQSFVEEATQDMRRLARTEDIRPQLYRLVELEAAIRQSFVEEATQEMHRLARTEEFRSQLCLLVELEAAIRQSFVEEASQHAYRLFAKRSRLTCKRQRSITAGEDATERTSSQQTGLTARVATATAVPVSQRRAAPKSNVSSRDPVVATPVTSPPPSPPSPPPSPTTKSGASDNLRTMDTVLALAGDYLAILRLVPAFADITPSTEAAIKGKLSFMRLSPVLHPDKNLEVGRKATEAFQVLVQAHEDFQAACQAPPPRTTVPPPTKPRPERRPQKRPREKSTLEADAPTTLITRVDEIHADGLSDEQQRSFVNQFPAGTELHCAWSKPGEDEVLHWRCTITKGGRYPKVDWTHSLAPPGTPEAPAWTFLIDEEDGEPHIVHGNLPSSSRVGTVHSICILPRSAAPPRTASDILSTDQLNE